MNLRLDAKGEIPWESIGILTKVVPGFVAAAVLVFLNRNAADFKDDIFISFTGSRLPDETDTVVELELY